MTNIKLKDILNFDEIKNLFSHFSTTTGFDIVLYDTNGTSLLSNKREGSICNLVKDRTQCIDSIIYAGKKAKELKEPYIFEGSCGLILCAIAIEFEDILLGEIVCGPVILWDADDLALRELKEKTSNFIADNSIALDSIPQANCNTLTSAVTILSILINHICKDAEEYMKQNLELLKVQKQLVQLEKRKSEGDFNSLYTDKKMSFAKYPVQIERELIAFVQLGESQKAKSLLNSLLYEIFCYASGDLNIIKARLYEFKAFLSRAVIEVGIPLSNLSELHKKATQLLSPNLEYVDVCTLSTEILNGFLDCIYQNKEKTSLGHHLLGAIKYINKEYTSPITLKEVASYVGLNSFYLCHLFKDKMKITFFEYLSKVRIDKAKELLLQTTKSTDEIAAFVGFSDASSFSKAFKKRTTLTPAQYKRVSN